MSKNDHPGRLLPSLRRREFVAMLGSAAVVGPSASSAVPSLKRLGVLLSIEAGEQTSALVAALKVLGWEEGRNLRIAYGYSGASPAKAATAAAELLHASPDALLADTTVNLQALKAATQMVPIVFVRVSDPVRQGFAKSMAHPGGNITGFSFFEFSMIGKGLGLLKQIAPAITHVGLLSNPVAAPQTTVYFETLRSVVPTAGVTASELLVHDDGEIERGIEGLSADPNGGLIVLSSGWAVLHKDKIIGDANRAKLPSVCFTRIFAEAGGLMSYGIDETEQFRQAAGYIDRILKGERPGDLPVQEPTKFTLTINLKTAAVLGLNVSREMQLIADEVIE